MQRILQIAAGLTCAAAQVCAQVPQLEYQVVERKLREPAFTQGLEFYAGDLIHSSGLTGQSFIERLPHPGRAEDKPLWRTPVPAPFFVEGSSVLNDELYVLSWQRGTGWRLDPATGQILGQFHYRGPGWGLTHNRTHLIRSDGSQHLYWHRTPDFALTKTLEVTCDGAPLKRLNELEYAQGFIWANIWQTDTIVAIAPQTGQVVGQLNLAELGPDEPKNRPDNVLNGIAYDASSGHYWLTGKRWRHWYRVAIELPPLPQPARKR